MLLACGMGRWDFVFFALLPYSAIAPFLVLGIGWLALHFGVRHLTRAAERGRCAGKPLNLFFLSLQAPFAVNLFIDLLTLPLSLTLALGNTPDLRAMTAAGLVFGVTAFVVALIYGADFLWDAEPYHGPEESGSSKLWLQDLLIAVLVYGLELTTVCVVAHPDAGTLVFLAVILLGLLASGFAIAAQLCGQSSIGQNAVHRAGIFTWILATSPIASGGVALAWFMWDRALRRARVEQAALMQRRAR